MYSLVHRQNPLGRYEETDNTGYLLEEKYKVAL